eukprot:357902-Chlamydomonas_euryale.AAC.6
MGPATACPPPLPRCWHAPERSTDNMMVRARRCTGSMFAFCGRQLSSRLRAWAAALRKQPVVSTAARTRRQPIGPAVAGRMQHGALAPLRSWWRCSAAVTSASSCSTMACARARCRSSTSLLASATTSATSPTGSVTS